MPKHQDGFSGSFGVILAAVGAAIGLGNIWKFPYIAGVHGGAAFVLVYLAFIVLIGTPLLMTEFIIGRSSQQDVVGAFKHQTSNRFWRNIGWLPILSSYIIITFYSVVAGWSLYYAVQTGMGVFNGLTTEEIGGHFTAFTSNAWKPLVWQLIFMLFASYIVIKGIKDGIEKYSKVLMPLLVLVLIILGVRSLSLPGAERGVAFLLNPDFSKLTVEAIFSALGHAFFTLSIGAATMITYGAYVKKSVNLLSVATQIIFYDTLIALMAGLVIFPAVFSFGIQPSAGPELLFVVLPNVFNKMPLGQLFGALFFFLVFIAALTSAISLVEPSVSYLIKNRGWNRKKATIAILISTTTIGAFLSQGNGVLNSFQIPFYIGGAFVSYNIFDWVIHLSDQLLPIAGFFTSLFAGWMLSDRIIVNELSSEGRYTIAYLKLFKFLIRFLIPGAIATLFISTIFF